MAKTANFSHADVAEQIAHWRETLGCGPTDTLDDMEAAYRRLARQFHPDFWLSASEHERQTAESRMKAINAAIREARRAMAGSPGMTLAKLELQQIYARDLPQPTRYVPALSGPAKAVLVADIVFCLFHVLLACLLVGALLAKPQPLPLDEPQPVTTPPALLQGLLAMSVLIAGLGVSADVLMLNRVMFAAWLGLLSGLITFASIVLVGYWCWWTASHTSFDEGGRFLYYTVFAWNVVRLPMFVLYAAVVDECFWGNRRRPMRFHFWKLT